MDVPSLETDRLLMRGWREQDLEPYAEMCADPEVMRYLGSEPIDREQTWRQLAVFIGHWELRGYGLWVVERRDDGTFLGRVGLWQPEGWAGLELGWALARPHWGHGFATEAAVAARDFAWSRLGAPELISLIQPENQASRRVAERVGMEPGGKGKLGSTDVVVYRQARPAD